MALGLKHLNDVPNRAAILERVFGSVGGGKNPIAVDRVDNSIFVTADDVGNGAAAGQPDRLDSFILRHGIILSIRVSIIVFYVDSQDAVILEFDAIQRRVVILADTAIR